jgi:hypothetical protein
MGHRRLLVGILLLGVVAIIADKARQPGALDWFDRLVASGAGESTGGIDNRLESLHSREPADSFVIAKNQPDEKSSAKGELFPGVKLEWFQSIRDDTISSREEQACTLPLFAILQKADLAKLREASVGKIAYAQLFRQPRQYRGRLVTVAGVVQGVYPIQLFPNEYGINKYYQVWLAPFDNRFAPIVIYCLSLPKGFPTGDKVAEEVEATGFFFKRWAYQAKDATRTAPTILAKSLEWQKRPVLKPVSTIDAGKLVPIIVVAALFTALTVWFIHQRTKPSRPILTEVSLDVEKIRTMEAGRESKEETDGSEAR